jgi:hypothetical protein
MGGSLSRDKGQRAERAVIGYLQPVVNEVYQSMDLDPPKLQRNTLQSDGGGFDIVGLNWMALEVKHQEKVNLNAWWEQTVRQAKQGQEPVLFYKQNNVKFRIRIYAWLSIHNSDEWHAAIVDISLESFLEYFRKRLTAELAKVI